MNCLYCNCLFINATNINDKNGNYYYLYTSYCKDCGIYSTYYTNGEIDIMYFDFDRNWKSIHPNQVNNGDYGVIFIPEDKEVLVCKHKSNKDYDILIRLDIDWTTPIQAKELAQKVINLELFV